MEVILDDSNFQKEVIESDLPCLVDFCAPWCGPCRMLTPVIDQVAKENEGKIKVGKVNVDENPQTASQYGIRSIPTLLLFKDGKISWLDGITIEYPDFWFNVRPSNTEPLLRLNLEANNKRLMEEKRELILGIIRKK